MTNEDINKKVQSVVDSIDFIEDEDYKYLNKEDVEIEIKKCIEEIESLRAQLAKANERVRELELKIEAVTQEARIQACELDTQKGIVQSVQDKFNLRVYDFNVSKALDIALNKFAIEKKIEALQWVVRNISVYGTSHSDIYEKIEQLRKEQDQC